MAENFGLSFLPGAQNNGNSMGSGPGRTQGSRNPVQEAVQILSLRLPKVYGARSIAPAPLLTGPGGMGQGFKGAPTAQALAYMAGVPAPSEPVLNGGPYLNWLQQERSLSLPSGGGSGGDDNGRPNELPTPQMPSGPAPAPMQQAPAEPPRTQWPGPIIGFPQPPDEGQPRGTLYDQPAPAPPEERGSPYEAADREGRLQELLDFTNRLYSGGGGDFSGVNLYDPSTWR